MIERSMPSPLGKLTITEENGAIAKLRWGGDAVGTSPLLESAISQVSEYFAGIRQDFDLPLAPGGSEAQRRACAAMADIAFGHTETYGTLAKRLKVSAQAMGQLCGGNPIPILIPCHRVLGATSLGGFSGGRGVEDKVWLLKHEGAAGLLI